MTRLTLSLAAAAHLLLAVACNGEQDELGGSAPGPVPSPLVHGDVASPQRWRALAKQADRIAIGRVSRVDSHPTTTEHGFDVIASDVTLDVGDTVAGPAAATLIFSVLGGEVEGVRLDVSHTPRFEAGSRYLVMLRDRADGRTEVFGGDLGGLAVDDAGIVSAFDLDVVELTASARRN